LQYKKLGNTGKKISAITLGSWGIGGAGWDQVDKKESQAAIDRMLECGVNAIDTAPIYGFVRPDEEDFGYGYAEKVIGEAIRDKREDIFLVTKCGLNYDRAQGPRSMYKSMAREEIIAGCEGSLKRLGTDYIDLLFVHWPDMKTSLEEMTDAMKTLIRQGKILHYGLSNFTLEDTCKADDLLHVAAVQLPYSMVDKASEKMLLAVKERGIGTMTYGSLGSGILTGAYRTVPTFDKMDARASFYHFFEEPMFGRIQKLLGVMDEVAAAHQANVSQVAIQWSVKKEFVDTAILGVSKEKHARQNCDTFTWEMDEEEMKKLDEAVENL